METIVTKSYQGAQTRLLLPKVKDVAGVIGDNNSTRLCFKLPKNYATGWQKFVEFDCYVVRDGEEIKPTYLLDENNSILIPYEITESNVGKEVDYNLKLVSQDGEVVEKSEIGTLYFRDSSNGTFVDPDPYTDVVTFLYNNAFCNVSYSDGTSEGDDQLPKLTFTPMNSEGEAEEVSLNIPYLDENGYILNKFINKEIVVEVFRIAKPSDLTSLAEAQVPDMALLSEWEPSEPGETEPSYYMDLYMLVGPDPAVASNWYLIHTDNPTFKNISANGNADIAGTLGVGGDAQFDADVGITGDVGVNSSLSVGGDAVIGTDGENNSLTVNGKTNLDATDIDGLLKVNTIQSLSETQGAPVNINDNLSVSGAFASPNISDNGGAGSQGHVIIDANLSINNGNVVVSAGNIQQNVAPSGQVRTATLQDTTVRTLEVTNTSQFDDNITIASGKKIITPEADIGTINGTNSEKLSITTPVEVTGSVSATTNINIGQDLAVSGDATVTGALGVTGATSLSSLTASNNISQTGGTAILKATTVDSLSSTGNASVGGTFGVTGATSLSSVTASGNITQSGGTTTLKGTTVDSLSSNGTISSSGKATLDSLEVTTASDLKGDVTLSAKNGNKVLVTDSNKKIVESLGSQYQVLTAGASAPEWQTPASPSVSEDTLQNPNAVASVQSVYDEQLARAVADTALDNAKAPNNHASSGTTYGVGTTSNYGHVRFDELVNPNRTSDSDKIAISERGIINFVNSSVEAVAAYYITDSQGLPWATKAALMATQASDLYSGGVQRTPTRNDYTIVSSDESHEIYDLYDGYINFDTTSDYIGHYIKNSGTPVTYTLVTSSNMDSLGIVAGTTEAYERIVPSTRYIYNSDSATYSPNNWNFQYTFNQQYTQAQMSALNSGITATKVDKLDGLPQYAPSISSAQETVGTDLQPVYVSSGVVTPAKTMVTIANDNQEIDGIKTFKNNIIKKTSLSTDYYTVLTRHASLPSNRRNFGTTTIELNPVTIQDDTSTHDAFACLNYKETANTSRNVNIRIFCPTTNSWESLGLIDNGANVYATAPYRAYASASNSDIITKWHLEQPITIGGLKTFTSQLIVKRNGVVQALSHVNESMRQSGTYSLGTQVSYLQFLGYDNKSIANFEVFQGQDGARGVRLTLYDKNNAYKYEPLFQIDESGNTLTSLVHTAGNETIGGTKTFTSNPVSSTISGGYTIKGTDQTQTTAPSSNRFLGYEMVGSDGTLLAQYGVATRTNGNREAYIDVVNTDTSVNSIRIYSLVNNTGYATLAHVRSYANAGNPDILTKGHLESAITVGGDKTWSGTHVFNNDVTLQGANYRRLYLKDTDAYAGDSATGELGSVCGLDKNNNRWAEFRMAKSTTDVMSAIVRAYCVSSTNLSASLGVSIDNTGDAWAYAPSPVPSRNAIRNITISDQAPSGGNNGDIWIQYEV